MRLALVEQSRTLSGPSDDLECSIDMPIVLFQVGILNGRTKCYVSCELRSGAV